MPISSSIWHTFLELADGPMRRQLAIRWTNRMTARVLSACATQSRSTVVRSTPGIVCMWRRHIYSTYVCINIVLVLPSDSLPFVKLRFRNLLTAQRLQVAGWEEENDKFYVLDQEQGEFSANLGAGIYASCWKGRKVLPSDQWTAQRWAEQNRKKKWQSTIFCETF